MLLETTDTIPPPYWWFGAKSRIMPLIWEALGDVPNFVDPFFGSGSSICSRPHWPFDGKRVETVNDLDGYVANFWRSVQQAPDSVAEGAEWPINEIDLQARHWGIYDWNKENVDRLRRDESYYDSKIAGWWVWGLSCWFGRGWGTTPHYNKMPNLGRAKGVIKTGVDVNTWMIRLQERFRYVRVCCGDWKRVLGYTPTCMHGLTGILLDPPYSHSERDGNLYNEDHDIAGDVREWCLENGANPLLRIVLCGYMGEGHELLSNKGWREVAWKAHGGFAHMHEGRGRENRHRERLWFSPHCLHHKVSVQRTLSFG